MAPNRERAPVAGGRGQAAGGRGGGRGPHGGGRGPNPNAAATKKFHDNGSAQEKALQQQPQSAQGGSPTEPVKPGPWGSGPSFKDKLMAPKQEVPPGSAPASAPAAKDSAAKLSANGPDATKPVAQEPPPAPPAAQPPAPRPYAAAVTATASSGPADSSSDIQFGSFAEGDVAQSKEPPAQPEGPLPTAVPAAVEAVRQQSRQVIRTNSAPASANPAHEGARDAPLHIPDKYLSTPQQPSRMVAPAPAPADADAAPQSAAAAPEPPAPPAPTLPTAAAPVPAAAPAPVQATAPAQPLLAAPAREAGQHQRQPPAPQGGTERLHGRQGGHGAGPMSYAHAGAAPMPQGQPGGPGLAPHHGQPRHGGHQQHHPPPPPQQQQGFGPGPAGQPPQPSHHHMQQQPQQRGGGRGGPGPQQVPVQVPVPVQAGYPQPPPYGMQPYSHQPTAPINMATPQHGFAAVAGQHPHPHPHPHGHGPGVPAGQHGMPPPPPYVVGSPNQYPPQYVGGPAAFFPGGAVMGPPPVAMPIMAVPMGAQPHPHHPGGPTHMLASSPSMSVGFHVPPPPQQQQPQPPQQHAPPPANYGAVPAGPQPTAMAIAIPPPGDSAGSSAVVRAAAQAAINATNAAAPVSAVTAVPPTAQPVQPAPPHPPAVSPAPPQASAGPVPAASATAAAAAAAAATASGATAPAPAPTPSQPVSAAAAKPASTPPSYTKRVLKILDPSSHQEVNLGSSAGSATAGAGGTEVKAAEGVGSAGNKPPTSAMRVPPPKKVLDIKTPTARPKPEPKPAAEAKPAEAAETKSDEPVKPTAEQPAPAAAALPEVEAEQAPALAEAAPAATLSEAAVAPAPEAAAPAAAAVEAPAAAAPAKEPASFQIDVADDEELEEGKVTAAQPEAAASEAACPASVVATASADDAAAACASGAASGSASGDDSSAPGTSGAGVGVRKKNLKQAIRDAEAKGANNDLLSAFREPPPPPKQEPLEAPKPKEAPSAAEEAKPAPPVEEVTEHWEERADEAAAAETSSSAAARDGDTRKRYSRDYLLSIGTRIVVPLPRPLDAYHQPIIMLEKPQDNTRIGVGLTLGRAGSREADWGRGRDDRGRGGDFRGGDMRGDRGVMGVGRDRDVRGAPPGRGGPGGSMDRRGSANMDDGWQRRGPPPPPSPGGELRSGSSRGMSRQGSGGAMGAYGGGSGPVNLHKSDNRWQIGVSNAEDPEEEKKQKTFKGILNKLTPDNYDKLKQQILVVAITHQKTLEGFINQIFDKALIETTFSEMYANLCKEIHPSLPQFPSTDPNNSKPVDFRRLLLNKCQQEFEDGVAAMKKVKEREEHNKEEAEKEKQGKEKAAAAAAAAGGAENGKLEEGEIAPAASAVAGTDDARAKALAEAAEAERELKARRRMLGNIQFIGHLYKCGLLTERIIHSCIVQLLNDEQSPRPDDIECLCKLLTTLGKQLEEQVNKKGAANGNPLDVYFSRMERLRKSSNLDSRIKFAIQDVLDLRAAKWVSRRKVEGPKRIEDVHREAQMQMAAQASRDREERYGQRGPGGRGGPGLGGRDAPPPPGRFGGPAPQDEARHMSRGEVPRPLRGAGMERQASAEVSLRPPSYLSAKRTGSPAQAAGVVAAAAASAREAAEAAVRQVPSSSSLSSQTREERPVLPPPADMSGDAARKRGAFWVKELYEFKNKATAAVGLQILKAEGAPMGIVLSAAIREAFEVRGIDPAARLDLLKEVLVEQLTSTEGVLNSSMLEDSFGRFMAELDSWVEDNPKAPGVAAKAIGQLAAQGHLGLGPCLRPILEAKASGGDVDDEDGGDCSDLPPLVESGVAGNEILSNVLQAAVDIGGVDKAADLWRTSGLEAVRFFDMPEDADMLAEKFAFVSG